MAFKFGRSTSALADKGRLNKGLIFKQEDASVPGTPVLRKTLGKGILGEANSDGSIFLHKNVKPGSEQEKQVLMHEMVHQTDMRVGKLAYDDEWIKWDGVTYPRKNGKIYYDGEWMQKGSKNFPWEKMPWE